jgi:hypothetical protein
VLILTPVSHELAATLEDPALPPEERRRRFGQEDHVRIYGRDLLARIEAVGLRPRRFGADDLDERARRRAALRADLGAYGLRNELFICRLVI